MKSFVFVQVIVWCFCILASCQTPAEPEFTREISVAGLLQTFTSQQTIRVYYTTDRLTDPVPRESLFVTDARITVSGPDGIVVFNYVQDSTDIHYPHKYVDHPEALQMIPGAQYTLRVESDAGTVTGTTTIPEPVRIESPVSGSTVHAGTPVLASWSETSQQAFIVNLLEPPLRYLDQSSQDTVVARNISDYGLRTSRMEFSGQRFWYHLRQTPGPSHLELVESDRRYTIKVMALDRNARLHLFDGQDICGIEGGYGYFGSAVADSVDIYVVEP